MSIIQCKICNKTFQSMTELSHHICPNWKNISKWKNNPRRKNTIEDKAMKEFYNERNLDSETKRHRTIIKEKKCNGDTLK